MRRPPAPLAAAAAAGAALLGAAVVVAVNDERGEPGRERAPAAADLGLRVWVGQGCGGCHALAAASATAEIGPDLDRSLRGRSEAYVREAIVAPDARIARGYTAEWMPDDYARRIDAAELDALVRFVMRAR